MTKGVFNFIMTALSKIPSSAPMDKIDEILYSSVISDWHDVLGVATISYAVANEKWRPSPGRLREIAILLLAPKELGSAMKIHSVISGIIRTQPTTRDREVMAAGINGLNKIVELLGGWEEIGSRDSYTNQRMLESMHVTLLQETVAPALKSKYMPDLEPKVFRDACAIAANIEGAIAPKLKPELLED